MNKIWAMLSRNLYLFFRRIDAINGNKWKYQQHRREQRREKHTNRCRWNEKRVSGFHRVGGTRRGTKGEVGEGGGGGGGGEGGGGRWKSKDGEGVTWWWMHGRRVRQTWKVWPFAVVLWAFLCDKLQILSTPWLEGCSTHTFIKKSTITSNMQN